MEDGGVDFLVVVAVDGVVGVVAQGEDFAGFSENSKRISGGVEPDDFFVFGELDGEGFVVDIKSGEEDAIFVGENEKSIFSEVKVFDVFSVNVRVGDRSGNSGDTVSSMTDVVSDAESSLRIFTPSVEFVIGEQGDSLFTGRLYFFDS